MTKNKILILLGGIFLILQFTISCNGGGEHNDSPYYYSTTKSITLQMIDGSLVGVVFDSTGGGTDTLTFDKLNGVAYSFYDHDSTGGGTDTLFLQRVNFFNKAVFAFSKPDSTGGRTDTLSASEFLGAMYAISTTDSTGGGTDTLVPVIFSYEEAYVFSLAESEEDSTGGGTDTLPDN